MTQIPQVGDRIEVYDFCSQRYVTEKVVRVEPSDPYYNTTYIYSIRDNWQGKYDERLSTPENIKRIVREDTYIK
jgi:hypothetical protein